MNHGELLANIWNTLKDIYKLLDERLPKAGERPVRRVKHRKQGAQAEESENG
jgi:hypothetical protein